MLLGKDSRLLAINGRHISFCFIPLILPIKVNLSLNRLRIQMQIKTPKEREQQLEQIIQIYDGPLTRFIRARVASEEDAADILQEVWYQLSKTNQETELEHIRAWLYRVTRNKIIDSYRKKSPDLIDDFLDEEAWDYYEEDEGLLSDDSPEGLMLRNRFWEELYMALDAMPENQRLVFVKNELEGLTLREIAEQQGENLKTIISRKGYAIRFLRGRLEELMEEFLD